MRYSAVQVFSNSTKNLSPISPRHNTSPPKQFSGQYNSQCPLFKYTTLPTINPTPSFPMYSDCPFLWSVACCVNLCGPLFGFAHVYIICCTNAIWYIIQYALSYCCVWSPLSVSSLDWQLAIWQSALPAICKSSTREKFSTIAFVCPLDKGQI